MFKPLTSVLARVRWLVVLEIVGVAALCAVVLVGGRLLRERGWLEVADTTLILVCIGLVLLAVIGHLWQRIRATKRALALEHAMREQAAEHARILEPDRKAEIEALMKQFDEAVGALKSSRRGKRALHILPWCVVVGPPVSGKTTMLTKSGLNFPYTVQGGRGLRGVGGTRNCDWWFTDEGIFLDTAGRYTTESDDHEEWVAFLDLLRRSGKPTPINGAVVTIGMEDTLVDSDELLLEHAGKVRERLSELSERLQQEFPVYLVFTKCDLLDGFIETFRTLDKEERQQVWGYTIPVDQAADKKADEVFAAESRRLYERLCNHRLSVVPNTHLVEDAEKAYGFPFRFAVATRKLQEFVKLLVQPSPYHAGLNIRGFYFTSGTQQRRPEGATATSESLQAAGVGVEPAASIQVGTNSYFISDLFKKVVFADKHLARRSDRVTRRRNAIRRGTIAASVAATLLLSGLLLVGYFSNTALILEASAAMKDARDLPAAGTQLTEAQKADIDELRQIFVKIDDRRRNMSSYLLGRSDNLYPEVRAAYAKVVRDFFLVPCQERLARDLRTHVAPTPPGQPVDAALDRKAVARGVADADAKILFSRKLALYEMIAHKRPVDPRSMRTTFEELHLWTWSPEALGRHSEVDRNRIELHLSAFVDNVLPGDMRGEKPQWSVARLPDATLEEIRNAREKDAPVALIAKAMKQRELRTLDQFLPDVDLKGIQRANWVVHRSFSSLESLREAETVFGVLLEGMPEDRRTIDAWKRLGIQELEDRYAREWIEVLAGLHPTPTPTLELAAENLDRHTGAESAYKHVYLLVRGKLAEVGVLEPRGREVPWLDDALAEIRKLKDDVEVFTGLPNDGQRVMRDLSEHQGEHIWSVLEALHIRWRKVDQRLSAGAEPELEPVVRRSLRNLVESMRDALEDEVSREAQDYWDAAVGRKFRSFDHAYPFSPVGRDVPAVDFAEMFRPQTGAYDRAYAKLAQFTKPHGVSDALLTFSPEFEDDRRRVLEVQSALFPAGAPEPALSFLVAMENDADVFDTQLVFGDKRVSTKDMRPVRLARTVRKWSPADVGAAVRVVLATDPPQTKKATAEKDGPTAWSLFRLVESGQPASSPTDDRAVICRWSFQYDVAGAERQTRQAVLEFVSVGEKNPLRPRFFRRFRFAREVFAPVRLPEREKQEEQTEHPEQAEQEETFRR